MNKNLFDNHKNVGLNHKIAFSAMFLSLTLILQFAAGYMKFADTFININLSLLFLLPIFYFSGFYYGALCLMIRFIIGIIIDLRMPSFENMSGTTIILGQSILLCSTMTAIGFMYLYSFLFKDIKTGNWKTTAISISTVFSTTFTLTFLNMILITPLYFSIYKNTHFSIYNTISVYNQFKGFFLGINNYWVGTFVAYFTGNLVKYGIIYIIYFPFSKVIKKYKFNQKY